MSENLSRFAPRMRPNEPGTMNGRRVALLSLSFTTVLLAWSYFNFKVPLILDELIDPAFDFRETLIGFIMAMDNLVAVILQPYFGKLSDRTRSKLGRRMPYIIIGTCVSAFFFVVMPWVRVLAGFVVIVLLFDISMSFYRSVSVAIVPDYTVDEVRSKASALQQFIANMGGVVGFAIPIIVGLLAGLNEDWERAIGFVIVSSVMIGLLVVQAIAVKETPTGDGFFKLHDRDIEIDPVTFVVRPKQEQAAVEREPVYKEIVVIFKDKEKSFAWMMLVVFFAYLAFASIEAFFSIFATNFLGLSNSVAATLFLAYSVPMILSAPLWGVLGQKLGRKAACKIGLLGIIAGATVMGLVLVPLAYNPVPEGGDPATSLSTIHVILMVNLACVSMPWMCFIVNSFPIIWSLAPPGRVGTYTGIYYFFNQLAYTIGPVIMGLVIGLFMGLGPFRFVVLFPTVLAFAALSLAFMLKVRRGDVGPSPEELAAFKRDHEQID